MTFKSFQFSRRQIKIYLTNAKKDLKIALRSEDVDVAFRFGYDALIKLAVAVCAGENLRILSRPGHHIELITRMSSILEDKNIMVFGDKMRIKRNADLYKGGVIISEKEAASYLEKIKDVSERAEDRFNKKAGKIKLFSIILFCLIALSGPGLVYAADSGNSSGYGWAEKFGWLSFSGAAAPVDYGMNVTSDQVTGYAWSEKAGWISLNCLNALTCGTRPYGVVSDGAGNLSGYGWSEKGGWVNFNGVGAVEYQVEVNTSGELSGYAWSEKLGWINMDDAGGYYGAATGDTSAYCETCDPCNPPVLYWSFDDGRGATARDESSRGNNIYNDGAIAGAAWQDESQCVAGMCLYFDGADDYASRAYDSDLSFNDNGFSIGAWFRAPLSSASSTLAARYDTAGWKLWLDSSGNACFGIDDDSAWDGENPDDKACSSGANYYDNRWHFILAAKDGTAAIRLYIDGFEKASVLSLAAGGSLSGGSPALYVGIGADGASSDFKGFMDEFKIYSYARTADQIKQDYAVGLAGIKSEHGVAASFGSVSDKWMSDGLVGYWPMDESATTSGAADLSGNGNTGTYYGHASTTAGKFGRGGVFGGEGSGDNIFINTFSSASNDHSFCFWVNSKANVNYIFDGVFPNESNRFVISIGSNCISDICVYDGVAWRNLNITIPLDEWHHICVALDNSKNLATGYLDGVKTGVSTYNGIMLTNPNYVAIGSHYGGGSYEFNGNLDEFRIYNRALSSDEVRKLYEWAPGPVAHWKFDEKAGATAYDSAADTDFSGGNHGTINGATWARGKYGSALTFDGVDDNVDAGSPSDLDDLGPMTLSAWIYSKGSPGSFGGTIVSKDWDGSGMWRLYSLDGAQIEFDKAYSISNLTCGTNNVLSPEGWTYITITWDGSSQSSGVQMYKNGMPIDCGGSSNGSGSNVSDGSNNFWLGGQNGYDAGFNGQIDDVRIYNYARTQKQILEDMSGGVETSHGSSLHPILNLHFDEGKGATAYDSSIYKNNGTLDAGAGGGNLTESAMWTLDGKFGKGVELDGTDDYISIPDFSY